MDRKINWLKLILSFLIASFIFSFGLLVGYLAKEIVVSSTISIEDSARNEITNLEAVSLLGQDFPCDAYATNIASEKLDFIGNLISDLETKKGKDDKEVMDLKELYTILEVRHMLLIRENTAKCSQNYSIFLYFYSNAKECQSDNEKTSFILSYLRNKYSFVRVYSFDINLNSDLVSILKNRYKIDGCMAVVLDNTKLNDTTIASSNGIEQLLVR